MNRLASLLAASGVGVGAVLVWGLKESAVAIATCLERANHELISCAAPPDGLAFVLAGLVAIASAIALGALLGGRPAGAAPWRDTRSRVTWRGTD